MKIKSLLLLSILLSGSLWAQETPKEQWHSKLSFMLDLRPQDSLLFSIRTPKMNVGPQVVFEKPKTFSLIPGLYDPSAQGTFYVSLIRGEKSLEIYCEKVPDLMLERSALNSSLLKRSLCYFRDGESQAFISQKEAYEKMDHLHFLNPQSMSVLLPVDKKNEVKKNRAQCLDEGCLNLRKFIEDMKSTLDPDCDT